MRYNFFPFSGLADPYVKGQLGPYKFMTKTQRKTLAPKWHEEFKIPICGWDLPNVLAIEVLDKEHFVDDSLGFVSSPRHTNMVKWLSFHYSQEQRLYIFVLYVYGGGPFCLI